MTHILKVHYIKYIFGFVVHFKLMGIIGKSSKIQTEWSEAVIHGQTIIMTKGEYERKR